MTIQRINHGRGHSYVIDGRPAIGVTSVLQSLAKPALINWAANVTADYATDHWADLAELPPSKRNSQLRAARWAENKRGITRGISVHALASRLVAGDEVEIPEDLIGHAESYVRFLDEWHPEPLLIETVVASRRYGYCGTFDLLARMPNGSTWLLDVKTGGSGIYAETGLQLAAYASAETYLDGQGQEHDMPTIDNVAAVHVRADGYSVHGFTSSTFDMFATFRHLLQVARSHADMGEWVSGELAPVGAS
jgi:hypothetical protein